jgi:hypothetical protein
LRLTQFLYYSIDCFEDKVDAVLHLEQWVVRLTVADLIYLMLGVWPTAYTERTVTRDIGPRLTDVDAPAFVLPRVAINYPEASLRITSCMFPATTSDEGRMVDRCSAHTT